ncbi:MAG: hypothetical protein AAGB05_15055 [Pseudomonadota bacterium]
MALLEFTDDEGSDTYRGLTIDTSQVRSVDWRPTGKNWTLRMFFRDGGELSMVFSNEADAELAYNKTLGAI